MNKDHIKDGLNPRGAEYAATARGARAAEKTQQAMDDMLALAMAPDDEARRQLAHEIAARRSEQARKKAFWERLDFIAATIFVLLIVGYMVSSTSNAPQGAVTQSAPANVSQGAPDANAPAIQARAPLDTGSLTVLSDRDGSPIKVVIPDEPAGDFGNPDYSSDLDPDVGLNGYASGIAAINKLASDAATGTSVADAFRAIMTDGGGVRDGADAGYTDLGAVLLTVWYQRNHPGVSFADAAHALSQSPPDIRMIKKAAHVARGWVTAFNKGNFSYEYEAPTYGAKDAKADAPVSSTSNISAPAVSRSDKIQHFAAATETEAADSQAQALTTEDYDYSNTVAAIASRKAQADRAAASASIAARMAGAPGRW